MRKLIAILSSVLVGAVVLSGAATAAPKRQTVEGGIMFTARHPDGCYTGLSRHLYSLAGEQSIGVVGYVFDVDKATYKKPFKLEATGGTGNIDLDITFYQGEFATQDQFINDPAPVAPASVAFETRQAGGEKGIVPDFAVKAIVCLHLDETKGPGANATFTYTAGKGVK